MNAPGDYPQGFGDYVLLQAFAHGGMGEVFLAKRGGLAGLDRICVLKKLRPDLTENDEYVRRFIDEARVVVQLSHGNIANTFDVGRVGEEYYLAMEHVAGVNLRGVQNRSVEAKTAIPEGVACFVAGMSLEALDYAHRLKHKKTGQPLNLVHRDVSPQNVMVSYEGEIKLIDFGLAASELKEEHTESQVVMGKVAYMAPEQARGEPVVSATDQFAMGVILYELIVGERFYGEMNNYEIWQVVGRGGFVPRRWQTLNPELAGILAKALDGDTTKRFDSCGDFYDALTGYTAKHHPAVNQRAVRKYMAQLFSEDHRKMQELMQGYADVSAANFQYERAITVSLINPLELAGIDAALLKEASSSSSMGAFAALSESEAPPTIVDPPANDTEIVARPPSVEGSAKVMARPPTTPKLMRAAEVPVDEQTAAMLVAMQQGQARTRIAMAAMALLLVAIVAVVVVIVVGVPNSDPDPKPVEVVAVVDPPEHDHLKEPVEVEPVEVEEPVEVVAVVEKKPRIPRKRKDPKVEVVEEPVVKVDNTAAEWARVRRIFDSCQNPCAATWLRAGPDALTNRAMVDSIKQCRVACRRE